MATEKHKLEVDSNFVRTFFKLADMVPPDEFGAKELNDALSKIKQKIITSGDLNILDNEQGEDLCETLSKNVLIVDDLGIITYQLDTIFQKMGFTSSISHEIYDAIDKFKKQDFGYAVIDLFIPTEREGFILLDELKKLSLLCRLNTKIIVMTASSKSDYKSKCLNRGADFYIEKVVGWQKKIMEICFATT